MFNLEYHLPTASFRAARIYAMLYTRTVATTTKKTGAAFRTINEASREKNNKEGLRHLGRVGDNDSSNTNPFV